MSSLEDGVLTAIQPGADDSLLFVGYLWSTRKVIDRSDADNGLFLVTAIVVAWVSNAIVGMPSSGWGCGVFNYALVRMIHKSYETAYSHIPGEANFA
jgi:hypothetical protein